MEFYLLFFPCSDKKIKIHFTMFGTDVRWWIFLTHKLSKTKSNCCILLCFGQKSICHGNAYSSSLVIAVKNRVKLKNFWSWGAQELKMEMKCNWIQKAIYAKMNNHHDLPSHTHTVCNYTVAEWLPKIKQSETLKCAKDISCSPPRML